MKNLLFIVLSILVSCSTNPSNQPNFIVEHEGALKNMMHKGDISAKADLSELKETEHLYAIGALENLKGEIQIFNGKPFNTSVTDSSLSFNNSFDIKVTLLVYASVSKWKSINVPDHVVTYEQLESYIAEIAKKNNVNIEEPFPFLIEGTPKSFDWHVINWKDGDTEHSHEKHVSSGLHGTLENKAVEMLGFYSNSHHAIFTHHTTNMHIHVKTVDNKVAGHVDRLTLGEGMTLKLPEIE
tara:strand:+ start:2825 stop:3544 length:720 start_codon:yes stop_codon:yes gene_type:complete